jgi:hypothetical protein
MRDGIYRVRIVTPDSIDAGVCLINNGRISGGNETHYFTGEITVEHERLKGKVKATRYARATASSIMPRLDEFHILMDGVACGDYAQVSEEVAEMPGSAATVSYLRLGDL